jgi:hypothetical protein
MDMIATSFDIADDPFEGALYGSLASSGSAADEQISSRSRTIWRMAAKEPMSGTSDPVVDAYKAGIDRTLIRENLKRSPDERLRALQQLQAFAEELRRVGKAPHIRDEQAAEGSANKA